MKRLYAFIVAAALCFSPTVAQAWWQSIQQSATGVTISKTDNAQDATTLSTYTWASRAFAIKSGLVVAAVTSRIGANTTATLNSVTIGGVSATLIADSRNTAGGSLTTTSLWQAVVPSGTTATITAVFSNIMARAGCEVFSVRGSNGTAPSGAALANFTGTSAGAVATGTVTVPTNGATLIVGSLSSVTGTPGITPTNYISGGSPVNIASTLWYAFGTDNTAGSVDYTTTWTGTSPAIPTGLFAAWGP